MPAGQGGGGFFHCRWNGQGTWPSRAGPYFFGEIGERTPRGRRFLPLGTPFSGGKNRGRWLVRLESGLRPPEPTPHGPPTGSGGREKWFVDGRKKWEIERVFSPFSQRAPTHAPSPPSRWAGHYQRSNERAAGQVPRKKYSLPPHNPTREGGPGGGTSSPGGSFPHFLGRNGAPAGQAKVPARSNGVERKPTTPLSRLPHTPGPAPGTSAAPAESALWAHSRKSAHAPGSQSCPRRPESGHTSGPAHKRPPHRAPGTGEEVEGPLRLGAGVSHGPQRIQEEVPVAPVHRHVRRLTGTPGHHQLEEAGAQT